MKNTPEEGMNEKTIAFLLEIIFNPNIENGKFKYFDLGKRLVLDEIDSLKDNVKKYSLQRLLEILGEKTPLQYNSIGYKDDLVKSQTNNY